MATHNRAGEITYEQLDDVTIRATITTYTRTSSFSADRDSLELVWGDGQTSLVYRINNGGEELENDIKINIYQAEHSYPTRGTYTMSLVDPNRIAGILNIDFPNSVNIQFYLETTFTLLDPRFQGSNSSVILLQPPIDYACPNQPFTYNPNAYDPDGDSIAYQLITPFQGIGIEVPNYVLPDQISAGVDNLVTLDTRTGDFLWNSPKIQGEFNITYRINEYRSGVLINSLVRDMQILVRACAEGNRPPEIEVIDEYCVIAGETIIIDIESTDPDTSEILALSVLGGPLTIRNGAEFTQIITNVPSSVNGRIVWETSCDLVSDEFYQIVIKSTDAATRPRSALATLRTIRIKIIAPSPEILDVSKTNDDVSIIWNAPYECDNGARFQGFSVWRAVGADNVVIDSCIGGLEGTAYQKVIFLTSEIEAESYIAMDSGLERGKIYCYRVVAEFADMTEAGNIYNRSASLPSEAICIRSSGEESLMTHVSVIETNAAIGQMEIQWALPDLNLIDTTELVGPYKLELFESSGFFGENFDQVALFSSLPVSSLRELHDTIYVSTDLSTLNEPYSYRVDLVSGNMAFASDIASSIYLDIMGDDKSIIMNWEEFVPWNNYSYIVYEVLDGGDLVKLTAADDNTYNRTGLVNGQEYCYVVESYGSYGLKGIADPLINASNVACAIPRDLAAPCVPAFSVRSVCDDPSLNLGTELVNAIIWEKCDELDLSGYRIYFKEAGSDEFELIREIDKEATNFNHVFDDNIAGCYRITSFDTGGNESESEAELCIDNCPSFILPNAFTPNADQSNDLFVPRINNFIDKVEFEVFNRWGQKVWSTNDPMINWDGRNFEDKELAEGTYYYYCKVFEKRVTGVEERADILKGNIQLLK
jgi:gliding motility-associated-like protein